ncbi:MAG: YiiX/YebB-like N1pC/P60 family cysteine hydrolase [Pseudomonadota bacterium]
MDWILNLLGRKLAKYLSKRLPQGAQAATSPPEKLAGALEPGDVLLVEGNTRVSVAIKYLTQSTWSHSALYIGDALGAPPAGEEPKVLIEADLRAGVRAVPLSRFAGLHTRICRPVGLAPEDLRKVIDFAVANIGEAYDLKNLLDLVRYVLPTPPVPSRWRRRMIALGSGDPTRAICSTLIAEAFGLVRYPILPTYLPPQPGAQAEAAQEELLQIRHHSLYVPRDFDISPYFAIVKPSLLHDFNYRKLRWAEQRGKSIGP